MESSGDGPPMASFCYLQSGDVVKEEMVFGSIRNGSTD